MLAFMHASEGPEIVRAAAASSNSRPLVLVGAWFRGLGYRVMLQGMLFFMFWCLVSININVIRHDLIAFHHTLGLATLHLHES